jgi:hypothetical protein
MDAKTKLAFEKLMKTKIAKIAKDPYIMHEYVLSGAKNDNESRLQALKSRVIIEERNLSILKSRMMALDNCQK